MSIKLPIQGVAMTATGAVKPVNTSLPDVTNPPRGSGDSGTDQNVTAGSWSNTPTSYTYYVVFNGEAIPGTAGFTPVVTANATPNLGLLPSGTLQLVVVASNAGGSAQARSLAFDIQSV